MSFSKVRTIQRWVHIVFGLIVLCYVYSSFGQYDWFRWSVRLVVVPVIVISGLWLWKPKIFNKVFKIKEELS